MGNAIDFPFLSARLWCCLAFLALLDANLSSLSTNASRNFSAMGMLEIGSGRDDVMVLGLDFMSLEAQVLGSMSSIEISSNTILGNAALGISSPPRILKGEDGCGLSIIRGLSLASLCCEFSSIFGCDKKMSWIQNLGSSCLKLWKNIEKTYPWKPT